MLIFPAQAQIKMSNRQMVFAMVCTNTPKSYMYLQAFTHRDRHTLYSSTDKHPNRLQETNTQSKRCMSGILLHNLPTSRLLSDMGKSTLVFNFEKKLKPEAI